MLSMEKAKARFMLNGLLMAASSNIKIRDVNVFIQPEYVINSAEKNILRKKTISHLRKTIDGDKMPSCNVYYHNYAGTGEGLVELVSRKIPVSDAWEMIQALYFYDINMEVK